MGGQPPRKPLSDATSQNLNVNVPSDAALMQDGNIGRRIESPPKSIRLSEYFNKSDIWDHNKSTRELQQPQSRIACVGVAQSTTVASVGRQQFHLPNSSNSHDLLNDGNVGRKGGDSIKSIGPGRDFQKYNDGAGRNIDRINNNNNNNNNNNYNSILGSRNKNIDIKRSTKPTMRKNNPHAQVNVNAPMSNSSTANSHMPSYQPSRTFQNPMDVLGARSHAVRPGTTRSESRARDDCESLVRVRLCLSILLARISFDMIALVIYSILTVFSLLFYSSAATPECHLQRQQQHSL